MLLVHANAMTASGEQVSLPARMRMSVDFPAPLEPIIAILAPRYIPALIKRVSESGHTVEDQTIVTSLSGDCR